jgi:hypothetical protein
MKPLSFNEWMRKGNAYYCNIQSIAEKYARYLVKFNNRKDE